MIESRYIPSQDIISPPEQDKEKEDALIKSAIHRLKRTNVLSETDQGVIFHHDRFQEFMEKRFELSHGGGFFNREVLIKALATLTGYSERDFSNKDDGKAEIPTPRAILALPKNEAELFGDYPAQDKSAVISIQDIIFDNYHLKDGEIELLDGTKVSLYKLYLLTRLEEYGLSYKKDRSMEVNDLRYKTLRTLEQRGVLKWHESKLVFDKNEWLNLDKSSRLLTNQRLYDALQHLQAYSSEDVTLEEFKQNKLEPRKLLNIPDNIKELTLEWRQNDDVGPPILNPWELAEKTYWDTEFILTSGEKVNLSEIAIAKKLQKLGAYRNEQNELMIRNEQGEYEKFNNQLFDKVSQINPRVYRKDENGTRKSDAFETSPVIFFEKYLTNLKEAGILLAGDFRMVSGTEASKLWRAKRKIGKNGFVSLTNGSNQFAKYFFGRTKFLNRIPRENIVVYKLSPDIAGIFDLTHGGKKLIYLLDLASPVEISARLQGKEHMSLEDRSANTAFNQNFSEAHLRPYIANEFIDRHPKETDQQYNYRVTQLNDPDFVIDQCSKVFTEAGIGIHNLPWSEQLILAGAILEVPQKDKIIGFLKQFGLNGARTLLSLDYDRNMGQVVFDIAKRFTPQEARMIFQKYAELVNISYQTGEFLCKALQFVGEPERLTASRIQSDLLRKAKELLQSYHKQFIENKLVQPIKIAAQLDRYNAEAMMFASSFKTLINQGEQMEAFVGLETTEVGGLQLSKEDIGVMHNIYEVNWKNKTTPEYWHRLEDKFLSSTQNANARFRILRHDGKIIAFARFVDEQDSQSGPYLHFGAFNVDPSYQNGRIGEVFLLKVLEEKSKEGFVIKCETNPHNPFLPKYLEMGFRVVSKTEEQGEPMVKLVLPASNQPQRTIPKAA